MNDGERRLWVLNDEGLYNYWKTSHQALGSFIRDHREELDEVIENVTSGKQRQHYLAYPSRSSR